MVSIVMFYYYKGSTNCYLGLKQRHDGEIDIVTDYGEIVTTVGSASELMLVLEDLANDKYA